jgi:hypothetical protein
MAAMAVMLLALLAELVVVVRAAPPLAAMHMMIHQAWVGQVAEVLVVGRLAVAAASLAGAEVAAMAASRPILAVVRGGN